MSVLSPWLLLLLLLIPLLIVAYVWILQRRRKHAVRYSSLSLIREALPERWRWRQHLPFALLLLGLTGLLTAVARPVALVEVPLSRTTIILALDVSRSMCANDVAPNRLTVAQEAALAFIEDQADGTQIGIVAFADFAEVVAPPTTDKEALTTAVESLTTALGTAIGSATLKSIDAIAAVNPAVAPSGVNLQGDGADEGTGARSDSGYQPDIIVLLTDGANSRGPLPLDAAGQAAERGVRVFTVGFGTNDPGQMVCTGQQLGSDVFGGRFGRDFGGGFGGGGGFRRFLIIDEETLQGVAEMTGGDYFRAESAGQLHEIFLDLPRQIVLQEEQVEISVVFVALGAVLAAAAVGLSLWWRRYP